MVNTLNVLLVGDHTDAPWHPLEPARRELEAILSGSFELTSTEDYDRFATVDRNEFSLVISYTDCWNRDVSPAQAAGLLRYAAGGGKLLVIHNGISVQKSYELAQMIGGKFVSHPPYQPLQYYGTADNHPLLEGVADFAVDEEPYMFELDPFTEKTVFLEFEFEGARYPAGWEHRYGLGHIVYLQPGHHAPSFQPDAYRRLVRNSAEWLCRK
jgi:type 1 glutamine amidotransferase